MVAGIDQQSRGLDLDRALTADLAGIFAQHDRVHIAFSGGRDSIVLAELCRPWRDQVTLIWANTGIMWPHMAEFVRGYAQNFRLIEATPARTFGDVWRQDGIPADVVPVANMMGKRWPRIQPWVSCCATMRTRPIFDAAVKDGSTILLHGQRSADDHTFLGPTILPGMPEGLKLEGPLWEWTNDQVADFVQQRGIALPKQYPTLKSSLECSICPANNSRAENELRMAFSPPLAAVAESLSQTVRRAVVGVIAGAELDTREISEDRAARWEGSAAHIAAALEYDTGERTLEDLRMAYLGGRMELFADGHASLLVEFRNMDAGKVLYGNLAGGDMAHLTDILRPQAEIFARAHGCVATFIIGRRGWIKVLRRHGYAFHGNSDKPNSWTMAKMLSAA